MMRDLKTKNFVEKVESYERNGVRYWVLMMNIGGIIVDSFSLLKGNIVFNSFLIYLIEINLFLMYVSIIKWMWLP